VAGIFTEVADLLEIEGANEFRVRAYRDAARTIANLSGNLADMVEEGRDLTELSGIGEDLAGKVEEIVHTGELEQLQEIKKRTPAELAEMLDIAGLGPKRVQKIYRELGVSTLEELRRVADRGDIRDLEGLGPKTEQKILEELRDWDREEEQRTRLDVAEEWAEPLVRYLEDHPETDRVVVAGSYRRRKETVGDLDILVTAKSDQSGKQVSAHFVEYEDVEEVVSEGETRSTVILRSELQVDLRVVAEESYGAALMYFTGSKAHNIALRELALDRDLTVNEYGVFRKEAGETGERVAGETEEEIYDLLDMPVIVPEMREKRGEIEAAREDRLPELVTLEDIRGDLQTHSTHSDGRVSLREMAQAAQDLGYEYLACTDHTSYLGVTQGLDAEEALAYLEEIDRLNEELDGIQLLKGMEVDIHKDGSLDLPDDVLKKLDITLCSVHSYFDLPREEQTERILRALDNPYVHILAHPTNRRIHERAPIAVDLERVMEGALERGCFLEVNAHPRRLDLNDIHCKMARDLGLKLVISTDAHSVNGLRMMRYGVDQARRGWLTADDVLNTRSWTDLKELLKR
jgi:DNA polymerase (family 10)